MWTKRDNVLEVVQQLSTFFSSTFPGKSISRVGEVKIWQKIQNFKSLETNSNMWEP